MSDFNVKYRVDAHERAISSLKISNSTKIIASASADKTVKLFSLDVNNSSNSESECKRVGRLGEGKNFISEDHNYGINDCLWGRDDSWIVTCSDDKTLKLWDVETERCLRTFTGHKGFVFTVQQHWSTGLLVSGSFDNTVRLWDIRQGSTGVGGSGVMGNCFGGGSSTGTGTGTGIRGRGIKKAANSGTGADPDWPRTLGGSIDAHADAVVAVDVDNSVGGANREFVSGSLDGTVRTWDLSSRRCRSTLHCENITPVSALSYSPNARFCLVSTLDGCHRLWDVGDSNSSVAAAASQHSLSTPKPYECNSNSNNPHNGVVQRYSGHINRKFNVFSRIFLRGSAACRGFQQRQQHLHQHQTDGEDDELTKKRRKTAGGNNCDDVNSSDAAAEAEADDDDQDEDEDVSGAQGRNPHSFICSGSEDGHVFVWDVNGVPAGDAVQPREILSAATPGLGDGIVSNSSPASAAAAVIAVDCACVGGDLNAECLLIAGDLNGQLTVWSSSGAI